MKEQNPKSSPLYPTTPAAYGPEYTAHLFAQYKLLVESSQKVTEWRNTTNNYFITVNSALAALYAVLSSALVLPFWRYAIPLAGLLVCVAWKVLIASYRDLNSAKFEVIHEMEARLPAALFKHEWAVLRRGKESRYRPISHVEGWIPLAFALLHVVLAGAVFFSPTQTPFGASRATSNPTARITAPGSPADSVHELKAAPPTQSKH